MHTYIVVYELIHDELRMVHRWLDAWHGKAGQGHFLHVPRPTFCMLDSFELEEERKKTKQNITKQNKTKKTKKTILLGAMTDTLVLRCI